jgi:hypothetical protein
MAATARGAVAKETAAATVKVVAVKAMGTVAVAA